MSDPTTPQESNAAPGQPYPGTPTPPPAPPYATPPQSGYGAPQQPYQPAAYPAPAYGYGGGYPQQKTNALAIVSMIASIVGFVWILPVIGSIAGVVMGHISLSQLKRTGEKGRGMAIAGLIVGYVGLALTILGAVVFFSFIGWAVQQDTYSSYSSTF